MGTPKWETFTILKKLKYKLKLATNLEIEFGKSLVPGPASIFSRLLLIFYQAKYLESNRNWADWN